LTENWLRPVEQALREVGALLAAEKESDAEYLRLLYRQLLETDVYYWHFAGGAPGGWLSVRTGLCPLEPSLLDDLQRAVESTASANRQAKTPSTELSAVEQAMIIFNRDPTQSIAKIARTVGCSRGVLYHDERFQRLLQAHQGMLAKGSKSRDGKIEAEADDEEEEDDDD
jgi:hypothetical protein